jgi:class 3 adenylate cyclase
MEHLGTCLVVGVDMWASSSTWPKGSAAVWELRAVERHNTAVTVVFNKSAGEAVSQVQRSASLGDGRMYVFPEALAAEAVAFVERLLWEFPLEDLDEPPIRTSVGIAMGGVSLCPLEGLRGRPVDIAARLATVAAPNQALAEFSARDAFLGRCGEVEIDGNEVSIRLPGNGSSWNWPVTRVYEVRRKHTAPGVVCNPQARLEQALLLREPTSKALTDLVNLPKDAANKDVFDRLRNARYHEMEDVRALGEALERVSAPHSVVRGLLSQVRGVDRYGRGTRAQPLEDVSRLPQVGQDLAAIAAELEKLDKLLRKHVTAGKPLLNSPLSNGDPAVVRKAAMALRQAIENIKHHLRQLSRHLDEFVAKSASSEPGSPRDEDPYVMAL